MIWIQRTAAVVCAGLGAALLILPFPSHMTGTWSRPVVQLQVADAPLSREHISERFDEPVLELSYEELEGRPEMQDAVLRMGDDSGGLCLSSAAWSSFTAHYDIADAPRLIILFRHAAHLISSIEKEVATADGPLSCFDHRFLGAYDNRDWSPMTHLHEAALEDYPEIAAELARLAALNVPAEGGLELPLEQWRRFRRRELDRLAFVPEFVVHGRLFRGSVGAAELSWNLNTPWLRPTAKGLGIVLVLLGLWLLRGVYRRVASGEGLAVSSPAAAVLFDLVSLVAASLAAVAAVDGFVAAGLAQPSMIGLTPELGFGSRLHPLQFVSYLGLLLGVPVLCFFGSVLTAQRLQVDAEGLRCRGAFVTSHIPWSELESVRARDQRSLLMSSTFDFRKLQTVLDLEGEHAVISLNQPSSRERKQRIVGALLDNAPPDKRMMLEEAVSEW